MPDEPDPIDTDPSRAAELTKHLSETIPVDPKIFFYIWLGIFTGAWAMVEYALDLCISAIFHLHGGQTVDKVKPVSLDRKIRFFRKAHSSLAALEGHKKLGASMADRVTAMRDTRHFLIHGYAEWAVENSKSAVFTKTNVHEFGFETKERRFVTGDITSAANTSLRLAAELTTHARLLTRMAANKPN